MRQRLKHGPTGSLLQIVQARNDGGLQQDCNRGMRLDSGYIWNVLPTGFADVLVVSGRERGVEAILRPFRRYSLDSLFPRGLGLKKKKRKKIKD